MPVICAPVFPEDSDIAHHFDAFGFPLSDFQKYAIKAIVEGHHVLVCAPTGSGKTLPAEFAIRYFIQQGKRVIYTSPIKALSNQKYHDFTRKFPDISVGLCTGDIKTNPNADLLIMTAEILNNRLFQLDATNQSAGDLSFQMNLETELAAVIMDEVHYINDESRGHVWEQTIMTLPTQVQMIMLSATLDGPENFAKWIEDSRPAEKWIEDSRPAEKWIEDSRPEPTESKKVYLASTSTRIVPLSHYAFVPKAPDTLVKATKATPLESLVKTQTGKLITLQTASNVFQSAGYKAVNQLTELWRDNLPGRASRKHILNSLATLMKGSDDPDIDDTMLPAIVFLFSRKQVEDCAQDLTANILAFDSKIPYNAARECEQIIRRLPNWREYAELPEYKTLVRLLEKGVGIHHSGMIPVLREIVELMISQKKIFMLFATESFAIGLDCPIRTAVFTELSKFDGSQHRFLYAHEYTQMAGRAGRRGIDTVGHVVHLPLLFRQGIPTEMEYKGVLSNLPQTLVSKFHIDYKMVLSLLKKGIVGDFHLFAERSMATNSLAKESKELRSLIEKHKSNLDEKHRSIEHLRTPKEACAEYEGLREIAIRSVNKKRKDAERKMQTIKDQHKYIVEDIALLSLVRMLESSLSERQRELADLEAYLKNQTTGVLDVLLDHGILSESNEQTRTYALSSPLGQIASQLAEVHPIPLAKLVLSENWFDGFSATQLVGILSVFTDVRLPDSQRSAFPKCDDAVVLDAFRILQETYNDLFVEEIGKQLNTGVSYSDALCYDMADLLMEWCGLKEEHECKEFLASCVATGLSSGDFSKACLKLSAVSKELIAMCESFCGDASALEFAHKLSSIDALILKHIATTQSLYL